MAIHYIESSWDCECEADYCQTPQHCEEKRYADNRKEASPVPEPGSGPRVRRERLVDMLGWAAMAMEEQAENHTRKGRRELASIFSDAKVDTDLLRQLVEKCGESTIIIED